MNTESRNTIERILNITNIPIIEIPDAMKRIMSVDCTYVIFGIMLSSIQTRGIIQLKSGTNS